MEMNKPTIWIFSLEPLESRYTQQWQEHIPELLTKNLGDKFNIVQVDGIQKNTVPTPGAFLNFSNTNYWKSSQMCAFLEHYNAGETTAQDQFVFTDAWNPTTLQVKYMSDLLGFNWRLHALWHAGSYDPHDFLGRLIGKAPWVRHSEKAFFHAVDHNYFATDFHIEMFCHNLFECNPTDITDFNTDKIVRTGWPMGYMDHVLDAYKGRAKHDLILFPHRIAPEKQVEIFRDLAQALPEYEFVVCQDRQLTKHEYHELLAASKIVFSASLQETLGIGCYEGAIVDALPMVPDRLSYTEMYDDQFKYPTNWTNNWENYLLNKEHLVEHIRHQMTNYEALVPFVRSQAESLTNSFFTAAEMIKHMQSD